MPIAFDRKITGSKTNQKWFVKRVMECSFSSPRDGASGAVRRIIEILRTCDRYSILLDNLGYNVQAINHEYHVVATYLYMLL